MAIHFLFDLDGLLVDSEPFQLESFRLAAARHGKKLNVEFPETYIGTSAAENMRKIFPGAKGEYLRELLEEKRIIMTDLINKNRLRLKPGAGKLLELLNGMRSTGSTLQVVSSSSLKYIRYFLDAAGIAGYFDMLTSSEEVEKGKPHPDIYLLAAKKAGCGPDECVAFEDTLTGITAAKRAKIRVVAVPSLEKERKAIAENADYVFNTLESCDGKFIEKLIAEI